MSATNLYLSAKGQKELEKFIQLDIDAHKVLDLIAAEFKSDPMSTQCFDARIVKEAERVVEAKKKMVF